MFLKFSNLGGCDSRHIFFNLKFNFMKITNLNDFTEYALSEIPEFYDLSLDEKIDEIEALLDGLPAHELIAVYNEVAEHNHDIVIFDCNMLNEILSGHSAEDIIEMTVNGDVYLNHYYFIIDNLGHLCTGYCLGDFDLMDTEELAKDIVNNHLDA